MSGVGGKDLILEVELTPGQGDFELLGGLRSKTFTKNAEMIDTTSHGSNQNREVLDGCGIKSLSLSGSGVTDADKTTLHYVEDRADDQALTRFKVSDLSNDGRTYTGLFKITSFERAGEYNAEQTYSISLESSGQVAKGVA